MLLLALIMSTTDTGEVLYETQEERGVPSTMNAAHTMDTFLVEGALSQPLMDKKSQPRNIIFDMGVLHAMQNTDITGRNISRRRNQC
jgi:hypothetical protein